MALILDGKKIRDEIALDLKERIAIRLEDGFIRPSLAIIQIGDNKESEAYIRNKKRFGAKIGAEVTHIHLPESISEIELLKEIHDLNLNDAVHGILLQLPVPKHIHKERAIQAISPKKDADGLNAFNVKGLWINDREAVLPATTRGVMTMLKHYGIDPAGKHAVVIGRSALVGRPTAMALLNHDATVTICHSGTPNLEKHTLEADIIVTAVGRPRLLTEYHVRPGQVIIDVGITMEDLPERRSSGDADFDSVSKIVAAISPVPGGAGPLTVASLFQNLFEAYQKHIADRQ